jgi:hypothetical protein
MKRACLTAIAALVSALAVSTPALAVEYQVHGYAAQGFVYTDDNNFFGESSDGSTNYYEAGLNASIQVRSNLLFAAQAAIRDAGISDDGSLRLDYAVVDYRFGESVESTAGIRAGKVKNDLGFYNETRDVIFTRPSILMPAVYSDNQNQRSLVFTAPGVQLYGTRVWGRHEVSLSATHNFNRDVRRTDERLLINLGGLPFDLKFDDAWNAQIMDSIDGGRWQFGISHFFGRFKLTTPPTIGLGGRFDVDLTVFSARMNTEKLSVTAEYVSNPNKNLVTLGPTPLLSTSITADRGYLQGEYRFNSSWSAVARIDASFNNRSDRDGSEFAAATPGAMAHSQYSKDLTLGVNWRYGEHWGVWGEYHWVDGTAYLQRLENPGATSRHWSMLMLMAGFKF